MARVAQVGTASILRVEESAGPLFTPDGLLPDFAPEIVDRHRDWLVPAHFHLERRLLVMSIHSFVIRTGRHTILVDTCCGNHKDRSFAPGFKAFHRRQTNWLERLIGAGVAPDEVDWVMCTHLHVDHVGWNTRLRDGRWVPTFPKAKYLFARREFDYWNPDNGAEEAKRDAPIFEDSVRPVAEAGQMVLVDDGYQLDDVMTIREAPGHTPGTIFGQLRSQGQAAVFSGDMMHHPLQIYRPDWSSRFCSDPRRSAESRSRLLGSICDSDTILLPAHFSAPHGGRVRGAKGGGFRFEWLA